MPEKFFEEYEVGERYVSPGRTITEADIVNFAGVSGSFHEIHTNEELMKKSKYGRRIAHGLLIYSIARGLISRVDIRPKLVAFYGIDRIRFIKPVFIGDTIYVIEKVVEKKEKNEFGTITFEDKVYNQNDELVLIAYPKLAVEKKKKSNV